MRRSTRTGILAGLLAFAGCGEGGLFGSSVDGTAKFDVTTQEFKAKWETLPDSCTSGERSGFFGVDLSEGSDEERLIRIVSDPVDGFSVGTNVPGTDKALFITAADGCAQFDVDVTRTSTRVNDIWNVDGHALVDCEVPGLSFQVDLNFSSCH